MRCICYYSIFHLQMSDISACTQLRSCKVRFLLTAHENTFLHVHHRGMLLQLTTSRYCSVEHCSQHFFNVLSCLRSLQPQSCQGQACCIQMFREPVALKVSFPLVVHLKIRMKYLQNNRWFSSIILSVRVDITHFCSVHYTNNI